MHVVIRGVLRVGDESLVARRRVVVILSIVFVARVSLVVDENVAAFRRVEINLRTRLTASRSHRSVFVLFVGVLLVLLLFQQGNFLRHEHSRIHTAHVAFDDNIASITRRRGPVSLVAAVWCHSRRRRRHGHSVLSESIVRRQILRLLRRRDGRRLHHRGHARHGDSSRNGIAHLRELLRDFLARLHCGFVDVSAALRPVRPSGIPIVVVPLIVENLLGGLFRRRFLRIRHVRRVFFVNLCRRRRQRSLCFGSSATRFSRERARTAGHGVTARIDSRHVL